MSNKKVMEGGSQDAQVYYHSLGTSYVGVIEKTKFLEILAETNGPTAIAIQIHKDLIAKKKDYHSLVDRMG